MRTMFVSRLAKTSLAMLMASGMVGSGQAGPLADWWLNNPQSTNAYAMNGSPYYAGYGAYPYNAYTGYPNTSYSPILPAGLPQSADGWLPTGGYASQYYRAPTTYYRPVTTLDPNTGTTVTSLQPCASYQYQAQRIPLLTPSWSNYAYGGYGAANLQNRWAPITAPVVGSAAGQSSLSIASGYGTYGSSPVVQLPATGKPLSTMPALPTNVTSGYGGIYVGQPFAAATLPSATVIGAGSGVVPAAAWSTTTSGYGSNQLAVPSSGVIITPLGPPTTSAYPTTPYPASTYSANSYAPQPSYPTTTVPNGSGSPTTAPMPGSMGQSIMPSAVSPSVSTPSGSVFPPVMPTVPAPPSNWTPQPNASGSNDPESTIVPSLRPSTSESYRPEVSASEERPRFQLRSVERAPLAANTPLEVMPSSETSTVGSTYSSETAAPPSVESSDLELKLNMERLRPIPAPQNFDPSPEWKPALLNARDQTARQESHLRFIDGRMTNDGHYREVRFLNEVKSVEADQGAILLQDGNVRATLRPAPAAKQPVEVKPSPTADRLLDTSGWSAAGGK